MREDRDDAVAQIVVSVVLIDQKEQILVAERQSGKFSFIGGGVKDGEGHREAAVNEVLEELYGISALSAAAMHQFGSAFMPVSGRAISRYLCSLPLNYTPQLSGRDPELVGLHLFTGNDSLRLDKVNPLDVRFTIQQILAMQVKYGTGVTALFTANKIWPKIRVKALYYDPDTLDVLLYEQAGKYRIPAADLAVLEHTHAAVKRIMVDLFGTAGAEVISIRNAAARVLTHQAIGPAGEAAWIVFVRSPCEGLSRMDLSAMRAASGTSQCARLFNLDGFDQSLVAVGRRPEVNLAFASLQEDLAQPNHTKCLSPLPQQDTRPPPDSVEMFLPKGWK